MSGLNGIGGPTRSSETMSVEYGRVHIDKTITNTVLATVEVGSS